ncbi:MAG: hypothetical protein GY710_14905 [Desulfobacteraceae bacterium]|nr:hypothetical protein [Desulfobacteraceae bacterium]
MDNSINVYLTRHRRSDQGTEGILSVPALGFSCFTLELPWRDNRPNISCIPFDTYPLGWRVSKKWQAFHVQKVPNRSYILIHAGNFAGAVKKGFKTHVQGCVLLGRRMGRIQGQRAVLVSRATVRQFNAILKGKNARIIIKELWEEKHAA